jgi:large-conductance mechanosensitive channel
LTSRELTLNINGADIKLDYFVQGFIDHVISGMVTALEDTAQIKTLQLTIGDEDVAMNVNGAVIPLNNFVRTVVRNTVLGMVSSLKGIDRVEKLKLHIAK